MLTTKHFKHKLFKKPGSPSRVQLIIFIVVFGCIGGYLLLHSFASPNVNLAGDVNGDNVVNSADFDILKANYGTTIAANIAIADINGDGAVNIIDFSIMASHWGTTATCTGVAMTAGQADIDSHGTSTTFCLSGTHNWSLNPKAGDQIIGDGTAVLDGSHATQYAFTGTSSNVVLDGLEIRNYQPANQQGAVGATGSSWTLHNLQVHDNGTTCPTSTRGTFCSDTYGGDGSRLGDSWHIIGGRYYNNRQNGLAGGGGGNSIVDGVEIDHNNFTDDTYTTPNILCNFEAGGVKWVTNGLTIQNSSIHDNGCRGLWSDIGATGITLKNNHIYNNWSEGIFIEISGSASISGNTVTGNGFKTAYMHFNGCTWGEGGGITISASGHTDTTPNGLITITGNDVEGNCAALTGIEELRTSTLLGACSTADPCQLRNLNINNNTFVGSANPLATNYIGYFVNDGQDLTTHNIIFGTSNTLTGINNCQFRCQ